MHTVVRSYSGEAGSALIDRLQDEKDEVETILRGVSGFVSWTAVRTDDGGLTITVCEDKAGTEQSNQVAREWVMEHASDIGVGPPSVSEGAIEIDLR